MKRIANITYHAPYNYGGNLQAYALQKFFNINFPEYDYTIINFRTQKQKDLYENPLSEKNLKNIIKKILIFSQRDKLKKKNEKFEQFISQKLHLTKEINNDEDLKKIDGKFDYYLCGSDQIWNTKLPDFNWNYFLEFTNSKQKISYAASFGSKKIDFSTSELERISSDLKKFKYISVREKNAMQYLKKIDIKNTSINVDPTLLIPREEWEKLLSDCDINEKDYVFYYDVKDTKENMKIMEKIDKNIKEKVIISRYSGFYSYFTRFKKCFDTGPIEFMKLIKNANFIVTSSFHGVVFSLIFNKPFLVINGMEDNRIKDLLTISNLEFLNINNNDCVSKLKMLSSVNFDDFNNYIKIAQKETYDYFKKCFK